MKGKYRNYTDWVNDLIWTQLQIWDASCNAHWLDVYYTYYVNSDDVFSIVMYMI